MDSLLRSEDQSHYDGGNGLSENLPGDERKDSIFNRHSVSSMSLIENKVELIQDELKSLNDVLQKQKDNDNVFRSQLQDVFEDVDSLKGRQRTMNQEQEKLKREIQRLKSEEIIDLTNRLDVSEENIEDLRQMQEKSNDKKKSDDNMDNEKLLLVISEMTKLKNQIYYLQQSILILRSNNQNNLDGSNTNIDGLVANGRNDDNVTPNSVLTSPSTLDTYTTKFVVNAVSSPQDELLLNKVEQLSQQVNECTPRSRFIDFSREIEDKMRECSDAIDNAKSKWRTDKSLANTYIKRNITRLSRKLSGVSARLEATENEAKKYNLIINGIPKTRKATFSHQ